jgi:hypothetical protein
MDQIFVISNGRKLGPYSRDEVRWLIVQGFVSETDNGWTSGRDGWVPLHSIIGVTPGTVNVPAPVPTARVIQTDAVQSLAVHPIEPKARGIRFMDIIIFLVAYIALWNLAPQAVIIPISALGGMALCFVGCAGIPPLRRSFYSVLPPRDAQSAEIISAIVALLLALLSLVLWVPLFTFTQWFFWSEVSVGQVILWFVNTSIFGYAYFLTRKISRVDQLANQQSLKATGPPARQNGG